MKRFNSAILSLLLTASTISIPVFSAKADTVQTPITRSQVEQRALDMINLTWTFSSTKNATIDPKYSSMVTLPKQFDNVNTVQATGIPYDWGGEDGLDTTSYSAPWTSFLDAVNKGAFTGNVNTSSGYGYITGTAGMDCSGFVQAAFNIHDYKQSTSTLFTKYFTEIDVSQLKHMDILDKPGDHVVIFDKWGTLNGKDGAFTYEATPDQYYGGIQGTKRYFISMNTINSGYIPGRYTNIVEDTQASTSSTGTSTTTSSSTSTAGTTSTTTSASTSTTSSTTTTTSTSTTLPHPLNPGSYAQIINVTTAANFRASASTSASLIGTIPQGTVLYLISYSNGWYQVTYNGQTGWVWGNLVGAIPSGKYVTVNNVSQLNIRSNPSSTASIVGVLSQNQYAQVLGYSSDGSWMKISINGIQGWAYGKYLKYIQ